MNKVLILLIGVTFSLSAKSQTVESVLEKMQKNFVDANRIDYSSTYELFKGHQSAKIETSYNGYVYRNGKQVYQKINNTEFIYSKNYFLQISHDENTIVLDVEQQNIQKEIDFKNLLEHCSEKKIEDKGTYYSIVLNYTFGAPNPFSVVKLQIDKESYGLKQFDLYYRSVQDFSENFKEKDLAQPHLRVKFKNVNLNAPVKESLFNFANYIEKKNNMLAPTGTCLGYELIDNRIK